VSTVITAAAAAADDDDDDDDDDDVQSCVTLAIPKQMINTFCLHNMCCIAAMIHRVETNAGLLALLRFHFKALSYRCRAAA